jgi:hypothetical protein
MIKQLAMCVLQKGVGSMDYILSMIMMMRMKYHLYNRIFRKHHYHQIAMKDRNLFLIDADAVVALSRPRQLKQVL